MSQNPCNWLPGPVQCQVFGTQGVKETPQDIGNRWNRDVSGVMSNFFEVLGTCKGMKSTPFLESFDSIVEMVMASNRRKFRSQTSDNMER